MLKCKFKNCYGLKDFDMTEIPFSTTNKGNKAIIYAPNGVMKTSFAHVMSDIANKKAPRDNIFNINGEYEVSYLNLTFTDKKLVKTDRIYVINSFDIKFKNQSDSISTIIADDKLKKEYDKLLSEYTQEIHNFEKVLSEKSGILISNIKSTLISDFEMNSNSQWYEVLNLLNKEIKNFNAIEALKGITYSDIINEKTLVVLNSPNFINKIKEYIDSFNDVISSSTILKNSFDTNNYEELTRSLEKNNMFNAGHEIILNDGVTHINNIDEWLSIYKKEMDRIQDCVSVKTAYKEIDKLLNKNAECKKLKDVIKNEPSLIIQMSDINILKRNLWKTYLIENEKIINDITSKLKLNNEKIEKIIREANEQKNAWETVINNFKDRFQVPFRVKLENQASVLLEGELPNLVFNYSDGINDIDKTRDELMTTLSVGEQRALYLLQVIFDINKISKQSETDGQKRLIIIDDIADSFDYKNKYAIIEYLYEISQNTSLDLLILTHNFDFYRSVVSRLDIPRNLCFLVQKTNHSLMMANMPYNRDYFKNGIFTLIKNNAIDNFEREKAFFAAVPFIRNLSEYLDNSTLYSELTNMLHLKDSITDNITIGDYFAYVHEFVKNDTYYLDKGKKYLDRLFEIADLLSQNDDSIKLEDKIILSMACRLKAEILMRSELLKMPNINLSCSENQTRAWYNLGKTTGCFSQELIHAVESVNVITPENIHLNAFMYEPLIDVSMHRLSTMYKKLISIEHQSI